MDMDEKSFKVRIKIPDNINTIERHFSDNVHVQFNGSTVALEFFDAGLLLVKELEGPDEVSNLSRLPVCRVVLPPNVATSLIEALLAQLNPYIEKQKEH